MLYQEAGRHNFRGWAAAETSLHIHWEPEGVCDVEKGQQTDLGLLSVQH